MSSNPAQPGAGVALCPVDAVKEPGAKGFVFRSGEALFMGFVVRKDGQVKGWIDRCPHTGFPLALYNFTNDPSNTNSRGARLNCGAGAGKTLGRQDALDPSTGAYLGYQWFDPSPYSLPTSAEGFGNCPAQGPVRGPGYANVDLSLQKNFVITERFRLQFRSDFLNAFNRVNLNAPSTSFGGNMGLINTSQSPRNIQFALKLYY